jgi:hypothetical protein
MAKKVVATLKTGKGKEYSKVITMVKSPRTGAYSFKEQILTLKMRSPENNRRNF